MIAPEPLGDQAVLVYLPDEAAAWRFAEAARAAALPGRLDVVQAYASVAMTGRQTGVYPLPRPGGWNLIGRTPTVLVDPAAGYFPLRVGDRVRFYRIGDAEYRRRAGERLPDRP